MSTSLPALVTAFGGLFLALSAKLDSTAAFGLALVAVLFLTGIELLRAET